MVVRWMIFDHYVAVMTWSKDFDPAKTQVNKTLVWARMYGLSLPHFRRDVLVALASGIGRVIKFDNATLATDRGEFARVCVELDLDKPVRGKFMVNDSCVRIAYEGLHLICTGCGHYGHFKRDCLRVPAAEDVGTTDPIVNKAPVEEHTGKGAG